ncbi:peptide ABC transporter permease [Psittacicella melopsittaci]|uniref:Peptide ABC transporter permease n=1 Tax=Psittacicella melopsittaci TaxID=2028576 RepID=A0A3A1Y8X7_9GAMM|nr:ABC transporter permease subunit [Psittacicella melopsittaci]RIY32594.1 peptide ABC transporter permease [Psittacicella melopsittaci]
MFNIILKKVLMLIPTFFGITLLTFILVHSLPGDPVLAMLGDKAPSQEDYDAMRAALGLDQSYVTQYLIYIKNIFHGDFGVSFNTGLPVLQEFFARFPATLELTITAMLFACVIGLPIGIMAALNRGRWLDNLLMSISLVGYSMPVFWWGLILVMFFSITLKWLPVSGYIGVEYFIPQVTGFSIIDAILSKDVGALKSALAHIVLPTIALGTIPTAIIARMTRSSMLEVLNEGFIQSLRARGFSGYRVIVSHALRNALIPIVTTLGLIVGGLVSGAILTETIFAWPGVGKWLIDAINSRDFPVIQSAILFIAFFVILINFVVDIIYTLINPRAK